MGGVQVRILVLTSNKKSRNPQRILSEGERRGWEVVIDEYRNLTFESNGESKVWQSGNDASAFDGYVFRGQGGFSADYVYLREALLCFLGSKARVLNGDLFRTFSQSFSKLAQMIVLGKAGVPVPPSYAGGAFEQLYEQNQERLPLVVKHFVGSHGSQVKLVKQADRLGVWLSRFKPWHTLTQQYLPSREDYRVLVVQNTALGAMKREAGDGFLTNVSAGGAFEVVELTDEMASLAVQATKALRADYAGVDIMYDDEDNPYVLEVNREAEFSAFEQSTGVNVASHILEFFA